MKRIAGFILFLVSTGNFCETVMAGGCGYYYRPQYYYRDRFIIVPQAFYQVGSELRDKAIATHASQLALASLGPQIQQQVQQGIQQGLQTAMSGRAVMDFNIQSGTGVAAQTQGYNSQLQVPPQYQQQPQQYQQPYGQAPQAAQPQQQYQQPVPNGQPQIDMVAVQSVFTKHCVSCHKPGKMEPINTPGKQPLDLTDISKVPPVRLMLAIRRTDMGSMPPEPNPLVTDEELKPLKVLELSILNELGNTPPSPPLQQEQPQSQPQQQPPPQGPPVQGPPQASKLEVQRYIVRSNIFKAETGGEKLLRQIDRTMRFANQTK